MPANHSLLPPNNHKVKPRQAESPSPPAGNQARPTPSPRSECKIPTLSLNHHR
nr:MAG TPA: hypothetical protein [Caudoviricetes sp.]